MSDDVDSIIRKLTGSMELALRGATLAEKRAAVEAILRLCTTLAAIGPHAIISGRSVTDKLIRLLPPDSAAGLQSRLTKVSPAFTGAPTPGTAFAGSSQAKSYGETGPTVADLLRRRGPLRRPPKPEKPKSPRHPYRVGVWVYHSRTKQVAVIEQRVPPRNGPNGPEDVFLMEAAAGATRGWNQFDIRLATSEEIEAERANRKNTKERLEREQAERLAKWEARRKTKHEIRGSCQLFAVAQRRRRRSEMLLGRAWDGNDHVVFEAVDGAIQSRQTYGSKGAATRAYNAAVANGYAELDADEERFDRLCPALVRARPARTRKRTGRQ